MEEIGAALNHAVAQNIGYAVVGFFLVVTALCAAIARRLDGLCIGSEEARFDRKHIKSAVDELRENQDGRKKRRENDVHEVPELQPGDSGSGENGDNNPC